MARARRSGRLSGSRTKYTDDPFELAGISGESGSEDQNEGSVTGGPRRTARDDSSDEDFAETGDEGENYEDEEDDGSEPDVGTSPPGTEGSDEDEEMVDIDQRPARKVVSVRRIRPRKTVDVRPEDTHSRGIWNPIEHVGKTTHIKLVFGTDDRDRLAMAYARDRWFRGVDSGFPSRASLNEAQTMSTYGCGATFGIHPDDAEKEATAGWDWYYEEDIGGRFRKRQRIEKINEDDARSKYLPRAGQRKHTVMVGPANARKTYELGQYDTINFGDAWGEIKDRNKKGAAASEDSETPPSSRTSAGSDKSAENKKVREGWILNLGNRIQCLAWAPNQSGLTQYLAVVVPITQEQKDAYPKPTEPKGAPAFTPSEGTPAALQIWAFKAKKDDSFTRKLDMSVPPKLRMVICTDWGDLRRIHWCPMPRQSREEDDEDVSKNLGLLAGIWTDGRVRVLDIKLSRNPDSTEFCEYERAAHAYVTD
ncbi:hypothetical protein Plec18167_006211 [Paecilomyces lecythidis]|uniref:Uncharacterized protein n=1 Tax=Paecilomyces lecythidis TaxID=3004212 RepID=A0ABR3XDJ2_9EURO